MSNERTETTETQDASAQSGALPAPVPVTPPTAAVSGAEPESFEVNVRTLNEGTPRTAGRETSQILSGSLTKMDVQSIQVFKPRAATGDSAGIMGHVRASPAESRIRAQAVVAT